MFDDEDREAGVAVFVAVALAITAAFFAIALAVATALSVADRANVATGPNHSAQLIFDEGSAQLPPDALTRIAPLLRILRSEPGRLLVVTAHGDPALAARRAAAVTGLLTQAGLSRDRIIHEPVSGRGLADTVRVSVR